MFDGWHVTRPTLVVQGDDKCSWARAGHVEIDVRLSIRRHITPLNHAFLLQLSVCELVWAENLLVLHTLRGALRLASDIVQV